MRFLRAPSGEDFRPAEFDCLSLQLMDCVSGESAKCLRSSLLCAGRLASVRWLCRTPCFGKVYDALPQESRTARVQLLIPNCEERRSGFVLHLAGTGDHYFTRRLTLGKPLLAQVGSPFIIAQARASTCVPWTLHMERKISPLPSPHVQCFKTFYAAGNCNNGT
jgi:hypothetical protein